MISAPTVFVLGAGASCPYGYPSGRELRKEICTHFYEDYPNYIKGNSRTQSSKTLELELNEARNFTDRFDKSSTKSIDLFLARNPEFEVFGKKAIIFRIFAAEKNSAFRERMGTEEKEKDWYSHIFDKLTDDIVKKSDYSSFCENNLSFITFNYDRSFEHFLYESLINSFNNIPPEKIKEQISQLRIIHVFGQIAGLEWQDLDSKIEYRGNIKDIDELVNNLRIIYEENENPELEEEQKLISEAQNIFFLGFVYAKENLELLNIPEILKPQQQIRGTALGLTKKEIAGISSSITTSSTMHVTCDIKIHEAWDSLQLLRQYLYIKSRRPNFDPRWDYMGTHALFYVYNRADGHTWQGI